AGRLGGEEFAIMLPETSRDEARDIAERIRASVASTTFRTPVGGEHVGATVSLGVAAFPDDGTDATTVVNAADVAAYRAKLRGRERVVEASKSAMLMPVGRRPVADSLRNGDPQLRRQAIRESQRASASGPQRLRPAIAVLAGVGIAAGALGAVFGAS